MIQNEQKPDLSSLAHFGVKGMRWGVRKKTTTSKSPRTEEEEFERKERIKNRVAIGAGVLIGVGAAFVEIRRQDLESKRIDDFLKETGKRQAAERVQREARERERQERNRRIHESLAKDERLYRQRRAATRGF